MESESSVPVPQAPLLPPATPPGPSASASERGDSVPQVAPAAGASGPPASIVSELVAIAGWTRLVSVVWWIVFGFVLTIGLGVLAVGIPGLPGFSRVIGFGYIAGALVYLVPLLPLSRLASEAARLRTTPTYEVVGDALRANRALWKGLGVLTVIGLVIAGLGLVLGVMGGLVAAFLARS